MFKLILRSFKKPTNRKIMICYLLINIFVGVFIFSSSMIYQTKKDLLESRNSINNATSKVDKSNKVSIEEDFISEKYRYTICPCELFNYTIYIDDYEIVKTNPIEGLMTYDTSIPSNGDKKLVLGNKEISNNEILISEELYNSLPKNSLGKKISIKYNITVPFSEDYYLKDVIIKGVFSNDSYYEILVDDSISLDNYPNYKLYNEWTDYLMVYYNEFTNSIEKTDYLNEKYNLEFELNDREISDMYDKINMYSKVINRIGIILIILIIISILYLIITLSYIDFIESEEQLFIYKINGLEKKYLIRLKTYEHIIINLLAFIVSIIINGIINIFIKINNIIINTYFNIVGMMFDLLFCLIFTVVLIFITKLFYNKIIKSKYIN